MTSCFILNREFILGTHICIFPLHGGHIGVQQRTVINVEKPLSLSLLSIAQSYPSKVCIYYYKLKMLFSVF